MLSLDIPIKKPITVPNFVKFEKELEELTEKYFGHREIFVVIRGDDK